MAMFNVTPLYGGAVTTVLPAGFLDASLFRSVPDTQEVYVNGRRPAGDTSSGYNADDGLGLTRVLSLICCSGSRLMTIELRWISI